MKFAQMMHARGYWKPAGDDGTDAGGGEVTDRGDNFVPTDEDPKTQAERTGAELEEDEPKKKEPQAKKDDEAEDEPEVKKPRSDRIPVSRHKEILDTERAKNAELAAQLAKYQQGEKVANTNEEIAAIDTKIVALETEYNELMSEGKTKDATAKMAEIRTTERMRNNKEVQLATQAATSQAIESVRYDSVVDRLEEAHPEIRPGSDEFDKDLMADVIRLSRGFVQEGLPPSEALQKAAKRLLGTKTAAQKAAQEVKPRVDEDDVKARLAADRKAAAVDKATDTLKKQPPDTSKAGADSDKAGGLIGAKDVIKMDYKDFVKLDDKALSRMRGDEL